MTLIKKIVLGLIILSVLVAVYLSVRTPGNVAETTQTSTDILLRTRKYLIPDGMASAKKKIEETITKQSTYGRFWRLSNHNNNPKVTNGFKDNETEIIIRAEVPVLIFTDDLQVRLRKGEIENEIIVDAKSASRIGKSDLGENRRHIIQLLSVLDTMFSQNVK